MLDDFKTELKKIGSAPGERGEEGRKRRATLNKDSFAGALNEVEYAESMHSPFNGVNSEEFPMTDALQKAQRQALRPQTKPMLGRNSLKISPLSSLNTGVLSTNRALK